MTFDQKLKSMRRRIFFAGTFKFRLYRLFYRLIKRHYFFRVVEFSAQCCFDVFESIKCGIMLKNIGRPTSLALKYIPQIKQHPKYRTYYHAPKINSTVGMHLGVDLLKVGDNYYPCDINLNAAIRQERRYIYDTEIDPILVKLVNVALTSGYKNIVLFADYWSNDYIEELNLITKMSGVNFIPASPNVHSNGVVELYLNIPEILKQSTLYIVFNYQHTPLDFFITNQSCTAHWLKNIIKSKKNKKSHLDYVDTCNRLDEFEFESEDAWPNLVIKLGGGWSGDFVKIARMRNREQAQKLLGLNSKQILTLFNQNLFSKLRGWAGQHHTVLYQKFLLPEINIKGHAQIIRSHLLISPVKNAMLSCHRVVSDFPLPHTIPFGIVDDDKPFIVNFSKGAHYEILTKDEERIIDEVSTELGGLIQNVLKNKFFIS